MSFPQSRGTGKGNKKSYIEKFYEKQFAAYRDKPIKLMEIGFRHGASLALWSKYFNKGSILGADNFSDISARENLPIVEDRIKQSNIQISIGDAYSRSFAEKLTDHCDMIIDDGPHTIETQLIDLELYLPKLKPGGVFFVEDILTGGLATLPLLKNVPIGFNAYFYNFRWHRVCGDNCLCVVRPDNDKATALINRILIKLLGASYEPTKGVLCMLKNLLKA